jgi:hypothetical protein
MCALHLVFKLYSNGGHVGQLKRVMIIRHNFERVKKYHLNLQWLHPSQMDVVTKNINSENGKNAFVLSLN